MTAQPSSPSFREPPETVCLGAQPTANAEISTIVAAHQAWVASGRPGAISHEEAMAELLGGR